MGRGRRGKGTVGSTGNGRESCGNTNMGDINREDGHIRKERLNASLCLEAAMVR